MKPDFKPILDAWLETYHDDHDSKQYDFLVRALDTAYLMGHDAGFQAAKKSKKALDEAWVQAEQEMRKINDQGTV